MNKSFHFMVWCVFVVFASMAIAQVTTKVDPPKNGPAPYRYVAPLINLAGDDLLNAYPSSGDYHTGTCDVAAKTDVSEVRGENTEDGWFVFDVSGLPIGAIINSITFYGYVNDTYWPYWSLTPMGSINPITDSASTIKAYVEANSGLGVAYVYINEISSFTTGWHNWSLEPQAFPDLVNAIPQGWFACGMDERDNNTSYWIEFDGWNEPNIPYLVIDYFPPLLNDVGIQSIDVPGLLGVGNVVVPKATVMSQSTINESFNVTMTINPGGYTSTKTVTNLPPASNVQVSFDNWIATYGTYTFEACTELAGDPNPANNCQSKVIMVVFADRAYGYNVYDQTGTYPTGTVKFFCQVPGIITPTGGTVTDFMCAGTFDYYTQTYYGYQYPGTNFYMIDGMTGGLTFLGSGGNGDIRGLAFDPTTTWDGQLYAVDGTSLYSVNETNGALTLIGSSGAYFDYIALACSPAGQLYGFDMNFNALISINKTTGAGTIILFPFPFDVAYAQGADYDYSNNVLYWAAWDASAGRGRFYIVDPTSAWITLIDYLGTAPGLELDALAIPVVFVPVELSSFTTDINGTNVTLNWSTATETNNYGFELQRSKSGGEFEAVAFVEGHGTTTEMQYYSYKDLALTEGLYNYRLKQVDFDGSFEYSKTVLVEIEIQDVYSLDQNYPNPFNPTTQIYFSLATDSKVTLKVFDLLGQEVATLINNELDAGLHNVTFNAAGINSGVYFYRIEAAGIDGTNFVDVKKMILTK